MIASVCSLLSGGKSSSSSAAARSAAEPEESKRSVHWSRKLSQEFFIQPCGEMSPDLRAALYWSRADFAAIRRRQIQLIEVVRQQFVEYGNDCVPPPIPGESRRGLGIVCELDTAEKRMSRRASARDTVLEAQYACSEAQLANLAESLAYVATSNARAVADKDEEALRSTTPQLTPQPTLDTLRRRVAPIAHAPNSGASYIDMRLVRKDSMSNLLDAEAQEAERAQAERQPKRSHSTDPATQGSPSQTSSALSMEMLDRLPSAAPLMGLVRNDSLAEMSSAYPPSASPMMRLVRNDSLAEMSAACPGEGGAGADDSLSTNHSRSTHGGTGARYFACPA